MSIEAVLKSFIYVVSTSLFIPTLFLLSLILVWLLFRLGVFFSEWLQRRGRPRLRDEQWRETLSTPSSRPA